jgi:hypothetical protein
MPREIINENKNVAIFDHTQEHPDSTKPYDKQVKTYQEMLAIVTKADYLVTQKDESLISKLESVHWFKVEVPEFNREVDKHNRFPPIGLKLSYAVGTKDSTEFLVYLGNRDAVRRVGDVIEGEIDESDPNSIKDLVERENFVIVRKNLFGKEGK